MCALFGLIDYRGNLEAVQRLRIIKALGTAAEVRGTDATGIAFFQRDKLRIQKAAKPAHRMKYRIPAEEKIIMGHTRMTTQGSASKNRNNHPFPGMADNTQFALAHNGVLTNDQELRQNNGLPQTDIETDSYVAVQLIEQQKEVSLDSLRRMAEAVRGQFTFTVLDQNNSLYFVKGENPLTIYHYPMLGLYLYASTEGILFSALRSLGMARLKPEIIQPEAGEILRIDRFGKRSTAQFAMVNPWSARELSVWDTPCALGWRWIDLDYIQELKAVASAYGYSSEEIDDLLSDGYTPEDIEEIIYEIGGFENACKC